jgi:hypothetical protein
MNRYYLRPCDYGENYDPPRTEPHQRFAIVVLCALAAAIALAFVPQAFGAPPTATLTLSTLAGESPASTVVTWDCKGATATATSTPSQKAWSGSIPLSGTKKMTGITIPSLKYSLQCDTAAGPSGFSVKWALDPLVNFDGSPLTDLLAWDVSYGTQAPEALTNHVRVPLPTARETFIEAPPGDYYVAVSGVVSRTIAGKAQEMFGHQSNIVQKTATATQVESTVVSQTVEAYTLPAAAVAQ